MSSLNGKVVLVTGGTRGIGHATCELLSERGSTVWACARNEVALSCDGIHFHTLDVTSPASCESLVDDVVSECGRIDCLVADAGITADALTQRMTDAQFDMVVDVNLKGTFNIVRAVIPYMLNAGYGSIVTVSSVVGEQGNIGQANYAATKSGVIGMTKTWAKEFARKGDNIRVNCVAPGYIMTDMLRTVPDKLLNRFSGQTMLGRLGQPIEVAQAIAFLCSDEASYVTGSVLDVNGGMRL